MSPVGAMSLVARVKAMLTSPRTEWPLIAREPADLTRLFATWVAVPAAIPAVCGVIRLSIFGVASTVGTLQISLLSRMLYGTLTYASAFVVVLVVALVVDLMAPTFGGRRNFDKALELTVYSCMPVWLAGVFLLVPALWFLMVLGLYGVYLLWTGLPRLMKAPDNPGTTIGYVAAILVCAIVIRVILWRVVDVVTGVSLWAM